MGSGEGNRIRFVVLAVCLASVGVAALCGAQVARADDCASLGAAANFGVFSDGDFNSSGSSGTSITGRIAAAGDVTLDGVFVGPASGDASPTVVAGGNFTAGRTTGAGGTVNGGVTYGGTSNLASNFTVNGGLTHAAPPFTFDTEFTSLKTLSASLGGLAGTAVTLPNPYSPLVLTGTASGLNVFTVDGADLALAPGIIIDLTRPGATALINVTTDTQLATAPMYMTLQGSASAAGILWNFPLATGLAINRGVAWQGSILAPNAAVTTSGRPQLNGQLIAASVPNSDWVVNRVKYTGCLPEPPAPPDHTLTLTPLCIDAQGNLDMRLRNTGDKSRAVSWNDLTHSDFGQFAVPAHSDEYFVDAGGDGQSVIRATSGTTTLQVNGTDAPCQGLITVQLVTVGDAPAGQTWSVRLTDGENGNVSTALTLGSGDSQTVTVPGGYAPGTAAIDEVVGGVPYTVSVDDPHNALETTISLNPVEILDNQNELVVVTLAYGTIAEPDIPPIEPSQPDQPTLPPGAPDPQPGPDLAVSPSGADLTITQQVTPGRVRVGNTVNSLTVVRNLGDVSAVGVVAREIPHLRPLRANTVAHVLSLTTSAGTCTHIRPVRCALGTLAPGATVTIRTRTRVLLAGTLTSTVTVSSETPETNTTNNTASATLTAYRPAAIQAGISAPPTGHVGTGLSYVVSVRGGATAGVMFVRLCTRPPRGLVLVRAPGTFRYQGLYCRNYPALAAGGTVSFPVYGFPSRTGRLLALARATAVGVARPSRALAPIQVGGPAVACTARSQRPGRRAPIARPAC